MKLTLEIDLGNDAMRTWPDIRRAIHESLNRQASPVIGQTQVIRDYTDKTVGTWYVHD